MGKNKSKMRDRVRGRAKEREDHGGASYLKLPDGAEKFKITSDKSKHIDFLPYTVSCDSHLDDIPVGEDWYRRLFFVHKKVGPEKVDIICPKTWGEHEKCPICEIVAEMRGDEATWEDKKLKAIMTGLRAKERELFNVVCLDDDEPVIKVWDYSTYLFGELLDKEIREGNEENADFAELDCGMTLKLRFNEEKTPDGKGKYYSCDRIDFEEREQPYDAKKDADFLAEIVDLDSILPRLTYEQIDEIFQGDGGAPAEPAEKPKTSRRGRKPAEETPKDETPEGDEIPEEEQCEACEGTGKTSRGNTCKMCGGTGRKPEEEPADPPDDPPKDEKEDPPETPKRGRGRRRGAAKEESSDETPKRGRGRRRS